MFGANAPKGSFRPYQPSEPRPRGAVTRGALAQRRSRASGLTRLLAEAIRGLGPHRLGTKPGHRTALKRAVNSSLSSPMTASNATALRRSPTWSQVAYYGNAESFQAV